MNVHAVVPAPSAPFTAIVTIYATVQTVPGGEWTDRVINQIEIEAFDVRDAWSMAQREIDHVVDNEKQINAYISGVVGPRGWEPRPEWIPVWSKMNIEQRNAHQNAACTAFAANCRMDAVVAAAARF